MNFADNNILLILISLVFIYAVLSILVSIIVEWWNYQSQERGNYLKECIYKLLKDTLNNDYGHLFYDHFTIAGLKSLQNKPPQYISSNMFAEAFIDVIAKQAQHNQTIVLVSTDGVNEAKKYALTGDLPASNIMDRFKDAVRLMNTSPFSDLLQSFIDKSEGDYTRLKAMIEQWYNDYMDRVSGWYKMKQRTKLLIAGFLVTITLNVDSLHLLKVLSLDDNLKNRLVSDAEQTVDNYMALDSTQRSSTTELNRVILRSIQDTNATARAKGPRMDSASYTHIQCLMRLSDSLSQNSFVKKDSVTKTSIQQLDSAMSILATLNVPIGWSRFEAPLSWFHCHRDEPVITSGYRSHSSGVLLYIQRRNASAGDWNWLRYLIGILISGFSLSFGAPFWFDLLVKLVNIRRAGKRPETPSPSNK